MQLLSHNNPIQPVSSHQQIFLNQTQKTIVIRKLVSSMQPSPAATANHLGSLYLRMMEHQQTQNPLMKTWRRCVMLITQAPENAGAAELH